MRSALICDDHAMMREAMAGLVAISWPDTTITRAADFPAAWSAMGCQPDLCICDLAMPGASPVDGIGELRIRSPATPILIVTGNEDDTLLLELFDMGVAGYVPKTARSVLIETAIRLVLSGERYLPARILELVSSGHGSASTKANGTPVLSRRQIDVLRLVAAGQSNKEIARAMVLSPSTIKAHLAAAMAVLGATNRTEAVVMAKRSDVI